MSERPEHQEQNTPTEPTGLPADLFDDPAKYDGDIPLWRRTVGFVKEFEEARPKRQKTLLDQMSISIARNPRILGNFIDNLSLISQFRPEIDREVIESGLVKQVEVAVSKRPDLSKWTPERIEELIRLGIDSSGKIKDIVEKMKKALFNAPKNPEEAVDLFYNAAWTMVSTDDSDTREEIFSILCYERECLPVDSTSAVCFIIAGWVSDDAHIKKRGAARAAMHPVGILLEAKDDAILQRSKRASLWELKMQTVTSLSSSTPIEEQNAIANLVQRRIAGNPTRYQMLQEYALSEHDDQGQFYFSKPENLSDEVERRKVDLSRRRNLPWPENLFNDPDEPLLTLISNSLQPRGIKAVWEEYTYEAQKDGYEKLTVRPVQITEDLELDIIARSLDSEEQKKDLVREVTQTLLTGKPGVSSRVLDFDPREIIEAARVFGVINLNYDGDQNTRFLLSRIISTEAVGKLSSIIEYYRPTLSMELVKRAEEQTSVTRDDLLHKFTRSVGKRGYQLIIADPSLKTFGYESMTFRQEGNDTNVSLVIDGQIFEFSLDSDYRIKPGEDVKRFLSPQDKAWLELLTLSHLKKLMCTEEDYLSDELVGGRKQHEYYRKQKIGRIEHLRRLPPGQNFSTDAYIKCLKSDLPVKQLDRINKMRAERGLGGTKETGIWTYIPGVERDIDTGQAKPVKVAFANATDDMRKVIPLGEISQEERERIEREILEEFGNL